jgi:hypothetical protein
MDIVPQEYGSAESAVLYAKGRGFRPSGYRGWEHRGIVQIRRGRQTIGNELGRIHKDNPVSSNQCMTAECDAVVVDSGILYDDIMLGDEVFCGVVRALTFLEVFRLDVNTVMVEASMRAVARAWICTPDRTCLGTSEVVDIGLQFQYAWPVSSRATPTCSITGWFTLGVPSTTSS